MRVSQAPCIYQHVVGGEQRKARRHLKRLSRMDRRLNLKRNFENLKYYFEIYLDSLNVAKRLLNCATRPLSAIFLLPPVQAG